jgi:hypothetical protein
MLTAIACGGDGATSGAGGQPAVGGSVNSAASGSAGTGSFATGGTANSGGGASPATGGVAGVPTSGGLSSGGSIGSGGRSESTGGAEVTSGGNTAGGGASSASGGAGPTGGAFTAGTSSGGSSAGLSNGGSMSTGGAGGSSKGGVWSGGGGSGGAAGSGDATSSRPLNVTAAPARHEHSFRAKDADSSVSFNDNTEIAVLDNRAPKLLGKLVLPFTGVGTNAGTLEGGGEFCARRGFHVLGIAAFQDYDIVSKGADFFGNARRSVFEGVLYTHEGEFANIKMTPADGVAQRTQKALAYLNAKYPDEDWGYFLESDGSVRWSDVIFSGFSHGGSNAARFAFLVRAARAVSLSAPRENTCTRLDLANCGGVVATWLSETPKTPIDRFFAITGTSDDQHLQHLFAMEKTKYSGAATSVEGAQPPYGNSHRLMANAGHTDFCQLSNYTAVCNYAFGVPQENQAGTRN